MKRKHVAPKDFSRGTDASVIREGEGSESSMGTFNAILASDGEASDGHILHIPGNHTPKRMPMLFGHTSDAMAPAMGSITNPVKGKTANGKNRVVRTTQVINMEGDGQMADIRRNVARLVHDGDLNAMSVRWVPDPNELIRRIDLPRGHYAFVDANEESRDSERYWGFFHKKSRSQEGSIIAIGADPLALKGRAKDMGTNAGAVFFTALARSIESGERVDGLADISSAFVAFTEAMNGMRKAGLTDEDISTMLAEDLNPKDMVQYSFTDEGNGPVSMMIPRSARDALLRESVAAYNAALGLHTEVSITPQVLRATDDGFTPEEEDAEFGRIYPELSDPQKRDIVYHEIQEPIFTKRTIADMTPDELFGAIGDQMRAVVDHAMGKVSD